MNNHFIDLDLKNCLSALNIPEMERGVVEATSRFNDSKNLKDKRGAEKSLPDEIQAVHAEMAVAKFLATEAIFGLRRFNLPDVETSFYLKTLGLDVKCTKKPCRHTYAISPDNLEQKKANGIKNFVLVEPTIKPNVFKIIGIVDIDKVMGGAFPLSDFGQPWRNDKAYAISRDCLLPFNQFWVWLHYSNEMAILNDFEDLSGAEVIYRIIQNAADDLAVDEQDMSDEFAELLERQTAPKDPFDF